LRTPIPSEELAEFETDVLAGCVLGRAAAGLADAAIRSDVGHLEQIRELATLTALTAPDYASLGIRIR
jgi:hypothetical protein